MNRFENFLASEKEFLEKTVQDLHRKKYSKGIEFKSFLEGRLREIETISRKYQEMKDAPEAATSKGK